MKIDNLRRMILDIKTSLSKFGGQCPQGQRGRPLSNPQAAQKQGVDTCEKKTKDGRTVYYKTGEHKEKEKKEKESRIKTREDLRKKGMRVGGRGKISKQQKEALKRAFVEMAKPEKSAPKLGDVAPVVTDTRESRQKDAENFLNPFGKTKEQIIEGNKKYREKEDALSEKRNPKTPRGQAIQNINKRIKQLIPDPRTQEGADFLSAHEELQNAVYYGPTSVSKYEVAASPNLVDKLKKDGYKKNNEGNWEKGGHWYPPLSPEAQKYKNKSKELRGLQDNLANMGVGGVNLLRNYLSKLDKNGNLTKKQDGSSSVDASWEDDYQEKKQPENKSSYLDFVIKTLDKIIDPVTPRNISKGVDWLGRRG